jgi:hypothetical protein
MKTSNLSSIGANTLFSADLRVISLDKKGVSALNHALGRRRGLKTCIIKIN